jgi:hypothetical protein
MGVEGGIDALEARAAIKVFEREPVGQRERRQGGGHRGGRILKP